MGFFDDYPLFYRTSYTGSKPNRLNARYEALIESNRDVIAGRRVLDIASHDGRWSFAALKAGAQHVVGVEGRAELVERATNAMNVYRVAPDRFDFMVGDAQTLLARFAPGDFDTVFCFGFLYHTLEQMSLISAISRLAPSHLLLDTKVVKSDVPLIVLRRDEPGGEGEAIRKATDGPGPVLVGTPSRAAVEWMLDSAGFQYAYYDWATRHQGDWTQLDAYLDGRRVTLRASPAQTES